MSDFTEQYSLEGIKPVDASFLGAVEARLLSLTKPPGSLGLLEEIATRLALIEKTTNPQITKKQIFTLAGDHGVTDEGVSAYPKVVTSQMVLNFLSGGAAINVLARHAGAKVTVVDMGVDYDFGTNPGLVNAKIGWGTANFTKGPAMSRQEAVKAIKVGMNLVKKAAGEGVSLIGVGEMGIGNTTSASAILASFAGIPPAKVVGRGTGVDEEGLQRKAKAVETALRVNRPDPNDPLDVLSKVGGFEIAGMTGIFLGAAKEGIPVIADGFISTSAALLAIKLAPAAEDYLFLSHLSEEKGHAAMVELFNTRPLLNLSLRLGEGTGAALAMGLVEASAKIMTEMATFSEAGVSEKE
jgi:nicotinate-nucleotide--dimethylbenzimidazole phosphoribosyltransferase